MSQIPNQTQNIQHLINALERRHLDTAASQHEGFWGVKIQGIPYIRIRGQARFWEVEEEQRRSGYESYIEDLITGLHGQDNTFAFLIISDGKSVQINMGLHEGDVKEVLIPSLLGTFPGIQIEDTPNQSLGKQFNPTGVFNRMGCMSGIPTRKAGFQANLNAARNDAGGRVANQGQVQQIERLFRGLDSQKWGYLVWASPVNNSIVGSKIQEHLTQLTNLSPLLNVQQNVQVNEQKNTGANQSVSQSTSMTQDKSDYWAQYVTELMEADLQRYKLGRAQGMWQTEVLFFAEQPSVLNKLKMLLKAIFAGEASVPDPIRTFAAEKSANTEANTQFMTTLTSGELATLCQLPKEEFAGYNLTEHAVFGIDVSQRVKGKSVPIGKIVNANRLTSNWFRISPDDFAKHVTITGVTGAGKTNTILHLLNHLWHNQQNPISFLVIEPAKAEYRNLFNRSAFNQSLRVYTLGDERVSPFRINPFEFEISNSDNRIHVQTHIDFLKSVFNGAFILYAPMPYVLDMALHEVYEDKGWNLTTSQNHRLPAHERGNEKLWSVFPTLTDLYNKIDEVVDRLGYDERIERDVKASLKTRIGSLRLGSKGLMLDTANGFRMSELLSHPTVLELERIGNDDEKAFLIGLILTRIYEYRVLQARENPDLPKLQHLLVFEEAHRLLKNVSTDVGTEEANTKAQAIEAFSNMLSEIRAYGQGVLIAEQIPSKLAPDAIKNTNLKLMHRTVALDDRKFMGGTMNLDKRQTRAVATLERGYAVAYAEGVQSPYLVKVPKQPEKDAQKANQRVTDTQIQQWMSSIHGNQAFESVSGYGQYLSCSPEELIQVHTYAQEIVSHPEFLEHFTRYFLSVVVDPQQAVFGLHDLIRFNHRVLGKLKGKTEKQVLTAVLLLGCNQLFEERGRRYGWFYNVTCSIRDAFVQPLMKIVEVYQNDKTSLNQLATTTKQNFLPFIKGYKQQTKSAGPFEGCVICEAKCLYRWDVYPLTNDTSLGRSFSSAIHVSKTDQLMWQQVTMVATNAAKRILPSVVEKPVVKNVAICYTALMSSKLRFSTLSQRKLMQNVNILLSK